MEKSNRRWTCYYVAKRFTILLMKAAPIFNLQFKIFNQFSNFKLKISNPIRILEAHNKRRLFRWWYGGSITTQGQPPELKHLSKGRKRKKFDSPSSGERKGRRLNPCFAWEFSIYNFQFELNFRILNFKFQIGVGLEIRMRSVGVEGPKCGIG